MNETKLGPAVDHGWSSFLPLLDLALAVTTGPVLELGAGDNSTPHLHHACARKRTLVTMESDPAWLDKFASDSRYHSPREADFYHAYVGVPDWAQAPIETWFVDGRRWAVALVDHAPGERRVEEIKRLVAICDVLVLHDSEPAARHGYRYDEIWNLFKHIRHDERVNTWATAVSNTMDVTQWR